MNNFGAQNMVATLKRVLIKKPLPFMSKVDPQKWHYLAPLNQRLIDKNYNEFYQIIKNSGAEIIELQMIDENEELCDSIFTHDPSLVLKEGAIVLNMGKRLRKSETLAHRKLYDSLDIPIVGSIIDGGTVEGGDCLWINDSTLLVGQGYRTNKSGIEQLDAMLKSYNIQLMPIPLPESRSDASCFHLMSIISMLDHDLAIGCRSLLPMDLITVLESNGIKLINMPEDEFFKSSTLGVNILALSPRNLVAMEGCTQTLDLLSNAGCTLSLFEGRDLCTRMEGGPTCLTRAIWRN